MKNTGINSKADREINKRVMVIGAGTAGAMIIKEMKQQLHQTNSY